MLVLLPPSETKLAGGDGPPLQLDDLAFTGELGGVRARLAKALLQLSARPRAAARALDLGARQLGELEHNVELFESATAPAIERYTGVLYDALDIRSLPPGDRARADTRLAVGSALFGVVRAGDAIPAYRLSAGSRLPRMASLAAVWKPTLVPVLAAVACDELVVDLRSGAYRALAPVHGAATIRVLSSRPDGTLGVVSHFNKATKGAIARELARAPRACSTIADVASIVGTMGLEVAQVGEHQLDVVTAGLPVSGATQPSR